ncbi:MAG: hypothetical protein KDD50_05690 [Bdellovibrionales bacterium]|nr:hypothetical protein [Bdellovibrionales bacterium]
MKSSRRLKFQMLFLLLLFTASISAQAQTSLCALSWRMVSKIDSLRQNWEDTRVDMEMDVSDYFQGMSRTEFVENMNRWIKKNPYPPGYSNAYRFVDLKFLIHSVKGVGPKNFDYEMIGKVLTTALDWNQKAIDAGLMHRAWDWQEALEEYARWNEFIFRIETDQLSLDHIEDLQ